MWRALSEPLWRQVVVAATVAFAVKMAEKAAERLWGDEDE